MNDETRTEGGAAQNGAAEPTRLGDETVTPGSTTHDPADASLPSSIGPYRILGKLGEGGMGVVFEAEQQNPRRKVALKVVRGGQFVDESQVKMFQREADTLARLKHPNIAAIYESGRTEGGQHFFAMELVQGRTLDKWGRSPRGTLPDLRNRLAMFRQIADAVNYAHQRGVIHRDLKPSNIIVLDAAASGDSPPGGQSPIKILDFGLARITDTDVAAASLVTEVGMIKGTLPYMSPEQARGNPEAIDLRTDVYALGVILYEMITGSRPYDTNTSSLVEAVRVICEMQPKSLSVSLRGKRKLDGDIETIVGKALEKDAERRYASAAAFSEDIERYLTSQPILARPPSTTYQLRKFARRNRTLVGGIAATFLVLVAGIVVSTVLGLREAAQRQEAEQARSDLESVVEFQAGMLSEVDPEQMGGWLAEDLRKSVQIATRERGLSDAELASFLESYDASMRRVNITNTALDVIDRNILGQAVETLEERFADQPLIEARLRQTIGDTYQKLGRYERAEPQLAAALETRRRILGDDHPKTLSSINNMGTLLHVQGKLEQAEPYIRQALEGQRRRLGDDDPSTLTSINNMGFLLSSQGKAEQAEPYYREALEGYRRVFGDDDPSTLNSINNLGLLLTTQGKYEQAERYYREALEGRRRVLGDDHPDTLGSINNMAALLEAQGKLEQAEPYYREALEGFRRVRGDDHPNTLGSINNLGALLGAQGKLEQAEPYYHEALEGYRRVLGDDHPETLRSINNLGFLLQAQGKLERAEPYYREALEGNRRVLGDDHPETLESINNLGGLFHAQGTLEQAEPYYREALEGNRRVLGDDHPSTLNSINNMGVLLEAQGKREQAEPYYREALEGRRRVLGDDHPSTLGSINNVGFLLKAQGKLEQAEPYYREALEGNRRVLGDDHPSTLNSINNMGVLLEAQGKLEQAEPYHREALEGRRRVLGDEHPSTLGSINNMGALLEAQGKREQAEPYYREALEGRRRVLGDDHPSTLDSIHAMGVLLYSQGKLEQAERYFRETLEGSRRVLGDDHPDTFSSIRNLGILLIRRGQHDEGQALLLEAVDCARRVFGREHSTTGEAIRVYGVAVLQRQKRYAEAEAALREAYEILTGALGDDHAQTRKVPPNLVELYDAWGKPEDAAEWRARIPAEH